MARIDAHQHFWKFDPVRDSWITEEMAAIQADFLPEHLLEQLAANQMDGTVVVQVNQSLQETDDLLQWANAHPFIKGVVGWVDLRDPAVDNQLSQLQSNKHLKGFRHIVQSEPLGFLSDVQFQYGIGKLAQFGFTYDILIHPNQLTEAAQFVKHFPEQKFVLDHLGKPEVRNHDYKIWQKQLNALSVFPNVHCKLSGLVTEANWKNWETEDFTPYLDIALASFGIDRLIYGSDWPVCLLAASYAEQLGLVTDYLSKLSEHEINKIMGENATRFYNL